MWWCDYTSESKMYFFFYFSQQLLLTQTVSLWYLYLSVNQISAVSWKCSFTRAVITRILSTVCVSHRLETIQPSPEENKSKVPLDTYRPFGLHFLNSKLISCPSSNTLMSALCVWLSSYYAHCIHTSRLSHLEAASRDINSHICSTDLKGYFSWISFYY